MINSLPLAFPAESIVTREGMHNKLGRSFFDTISLLWNVPVNEVRVHCLQALRNDCFQDTDYKALQGSSKNATVWHENIQRTILALLYINYNQFSVTNLVTVINRYLELSTQAYKVDLRYRQDGEELVSEKLLVKAMTFILTLFGIERPEFFHERIRQNPLYLKVELLELLPCLSERREDGKHSDFVVRYASLALYRRARNSIKLPLNDEEWASLEYLFQVAISKKKTKEWIGFSGGGHCDTLRCVPIYRILCEISRRVVAGEIHFKEHEIFGGLLAVRAKAVVSCYERFCA